MFRSIIALTKHDKGGIMLLIPALRAAKIAKRLHVFGYHRHKLIIYYDNSDGYTLIRDIEDTWKDPSARTERRMQRLHFRYLTDLFAFAKQEGFYHEIDPNYRDWEAVYEQDAKARPNSSNYDDEEDVEEDDDEYDIEDEFTYLQRCAKVLSHVIQ